MGVPEVKFFFFPLHRGQSNSNSCRDTIVMPTENINVRQENFYIRPEVV